MFDVVIGDDGDSRCGWATSAPEYIEYHDTEWGFPVSDDNRLFEKLCLEGFQSGLSWLTILRKREGFRSAFRGFEIEKVAEMDESDVVRLLEDKAIIRHRGKIEATLNNASRTLEVIEEFGAFSSFVWGYEADRSEPTRATSPESVALAKDLKKRGFKFVGPTTMYAFMQAMGLVNDHLPECVVHGMVAESRSRFEVPFSSH